MTTDRTSIDAQREVPPLRVLLTGATGFVGRAVLPALVAAGHDVRCTSRKPERAARAAPQYSWVHLDVDRPETLAPALDGMDAAIYLVHGMGGGSTDYVEHERCAAEALATAARETGLKRLVYLGGVAPDGPASRHLHSRLQTGEILRRECDGVVELRAAMIIGAGSTSWQICRDLAARLPFMVLPRWLDSRSEPVAISDVIQALCASLSEDVSPACYGIPGPEVMTAREVLMRIAHLRGLAPITISVPVLTPKLSSYWLRFVTRADFQIASELVEGLASDLVATGPTLWDLMPGFKPTAFDDAALEALGKEAPQALRTRLLESIVQTLGPRWMGETRASSAPSK